MSRVVLLHPRSTYSALLACGVTLCAASTGLSAQTSDTRPLTIGVIGAGAMGGPMGRVWADAGHGIVWGTRNPEELMELVASASPRATAGYADAAAYLGDVVVLVVPPSAIPPIGRDFGHLMQGKVVVDITNPRVDRDGEIAEKWPDMGTGLAMAQYLPGVRLARLCPQPQAANQERTHLRRGQEPARTGSGPPTRATTSR